MKKIIINPNLFLSDNCYVKKNPAEFLRFFYELTNAINEKNFDWCIFFECLSEMLSNGRLIDFEYLRKINNEQRVDINLRRIANTINEIYRKENDFLKHNKTKEICYEKAEVQITPEFILEEMDELIKSKTKHSLYLIGLDKVDFSFFTFKCPDKMIQISGTIKVELVEPDDIDRIGYSEINHSFQIRDNVDLLWELYSNELAFLEEEKLFKYYVLSYIEKSTKTANSENYRIILGKEFHKTCLSILSQSEVFNKMMRKIDDIISDRNGSGNIRELRTNESPDSPGMKRESDNASAYRITIEKSGAGWRLHYWKSSTQIELSNILKKNDGLVIF